MTKINIKTLSRQVVYGAIAMVMTFAYFPYMASAEQITARSVVIGSSVASASTTYDFTFTSPQSTTIKSVGFAACTTASGACTPAPGFSSSSSTLDSTSNLGSGGTWTVNTATSTELRATNTSNTGSPSAGSTVNFTTVTNPSATNSTFYMRITTYSDDAWTTPIDTGTVATSTAGQITVTASVDETLTFTLATATVALGTLSTSSTGTGTSSMTVATNATSGYTVGYSGSTLTSGTDTITAMAGGASVQDSKQFGINLMDNATPNVGADVSGSGTGAPEAGYGTADSFKFVPAGETIASASEPTNSNTFTTSYIANIDGATAAGSYSTVITYTATANF
jgi:hypothetical protein